MTHTSSVEALKARIQELERANRELQRTLRHHEARHLGSPSPEEGSSGSDASHGERGRDTPEHTTTIANTILHKLQAHEAFFDRFMDQSPFPTWIGDEKGLLLKANPALKTMLNITDADVVGTYNIFDDPNIIQNDLVPQLRRVFEYGETINFILKWNGALFPELFDTQKPPITIDTTIFPVFSSEGTLTNVVVTWMDITDRVTAVTALRESEEKYRLLFGLESDAIFLIKKDTGQILEVNDAAVQLYGYSREELLSMKNTDLSDESHETTRATKEKHTQIPLRYHRTKAGDVIPVEITAKHLVWNGEEAHIAAIRDISFRLKAEEARHLLEKERNHRQRMQSIGTLAGGIAHDFNNMLAILTGNISYAIGHLPHHNEITEVLRDTLQAAKRAQNLTHQLLTFAKGGDPIKKPCNINEIIRDTARFVTSGASSRFEFEPEQNLLPVLADENQLNQVLGNLIINADQAMPGGGIISIATENFSFGGGPALPLEAGSYVLIRVDDKGIGIPEEHLLSIFDPYFTTKQRGSGLGLATVYSIIKRHGGHITVTSTPGEGTSFEVFLPATPEGTIERQADRQAPHMGSGRVLIMDDQEPMLRMLARILMRMGYTPSVATNGDKAIELFKEALGGADPFVLVILDLTVPCGLGGEATIPALRALDPSIKAIVSSGYSTDPVMANYRAHGFDGVVPKPYSIDDLSKVLEQVMGSHNEQTPDPT